MEQEIAKDSELKTRKVERKDVGAAEKSKVSSPVEVERLTPTYKVRAITISSLYLRNRKHVPRFYRVIQTRVEGWENEKYCGNTSRRLVFPQLFRVLPNFLECLYNSIETQSTRFLFF